MAPDRTRLTDDEVASLLQECPAWTVREGCLVRSWRLRSFRDAIGFVTEVAALAEAANHHPDIDIRYTSVTLSLISHDAGGLTARDAAMVRELTSRFPVAAG